VTSNGLIVDEVIACPGLGSGEAMNRLVQIVTADGSYRAVQVAPDRLQFARTFRPTWAVVAGCVGLLFLFVGVLFFFVKTTETAVATIESDHRGTRLRLTGRVDRSVMATLRETFADPAAAARDAAQSAAVGAPVVPGDIPRVSAPPSAPAGAGLIDVVRSVEPVDVSPPPPPLTAPPPPVPEWLADVAPASPAAMLLDNHQSSEARSSDTIIGHRPGRSAASGVPRIVMDDGTQIVVGPLALLGRDPAPLASDHDATLVPIDDPSRSVSKTHLALATRDGQVWIVDRHSTNGTMLVGSDGTESALTAGAAGVLLPGTTVRIGARSFRLVNYSAEGSA
jgi:hypothetical protein